MSSPCFTLSLTRSAKDFRATPTTKKIREKMTNHYDGGSTSEPMHANALASEVRQFVAFSGDAVRITATDLEQAEAKYLAHCHGNPCPCGSDRCACIEEDECRTTVEEA